MNNKQKLRYILLGAGIMAVGITIGQFVTPDIEAQRNEMFDKITCREIEVVNQHGKLAVALGAGYIRIYDKDGVKAVTLAADSLQGNRIEVSKKTSESGRNIIGLDGVEVYKRFWIEGGSFLLQDALTDIETSPNFDANDDNEIALTDIETNSNRVATNPSYSDFRRSLDANDDDEMNKLLDRATELRVGLEFPRDTFAVDRKLGILVAHTSNGNGVISVKGKVEIAGNNFASEGLILEKSGNLRILTHYEPSAYE